MKKRKRPLILDEKTKQIVKRGLKKAHRAAIQKPVAILLYVSFADILDAIRKAGMWPVANGKKVKVTDVEDQVKKIYEDMFR